MNEPIRPNAAQASSPSSGLRFQLVASFAAAGLAVVVSLCLAIVYGIPGTGFVGSLRHHRANAFRTLEFLADLKTERLLDTVRQRQSNLQILSRGYRVRRYLEELDRRLVGRIDPGTSASEVAQVLRGEEGYRTLAEVFQDFLSDYGPFSDLQLVGVRSRRVLVAADPKHLGRVSAWHLESLVEEERQGHLVDVRQGSGEGSRVLGFLLPVHSLTGAEDADTPPVGALIAEIPSDALLQPLVHTGKGLGETGEALLVNQDARVLTHLKHPLADGSRAVPLQYRISALPARLAAAGEEGAVVTEDYRGVPVLAVYRRLEDAPGVNWGMVVKIDRSELLAPMFLDLQGTVVVGILGILALAGLSLWIADRFTAPVLRLVRMTRRLAQGDYAARVGEERQDELGTLAEAVDDLAGRLQENVAGLEARTLELAEQTRGLEAQKQIQRGALDLATEMASHPELQELLDASLEALVRETQSQAGVIYLARDQGSCLELGAALGMKDLSELPQRVLPGEGLIGTAARRKEIEWLAELPGEEAYVIRTLAGDIVPRCLVTVPLWRPSGLVGVLGLASLRDLEPDQLEYLEAIRSNLALGITNAHSLQSVATMAGDLGDANRELMALNQELEARSLELRQQAEEIRLNATELEVQRAQVEEANRLKSEFLSNMSHELRTPLNSILALSQLMLSRSSRLRDQAEGDRDQEFLEIIERNGRRLLELVNEILDLSRIESGNVEFSLSEFDPGRTCRRAIETTRALGAAKGLDLRLEESEAPFLYSDEGRLEQILLNLLANAVKYTEEGSITLSLQARPDGVAFLVRDTGIGISPEDLPFLFDEFRQVDGSLSRRQGGVGLGLAISRRLATALGGRIEVESEVGRGSCFTLVLPRHCSGKGSAPFEDDGREPSLGIGGEADPTRIRTVLVVEDCEVATLQIRSVLEELGHRVESVLDPSQALEVALRLIPDLVVLDLMMPEVDGFTVFDQLRAEEATRTVPVVILTAKTLTPEELDRLRPNHVSLLLQKGALDREELAARVQRVLGLNTPPVREEPPQRRKPAATVERTVHRDGPILVVEDNPDNRVVLTALLDAQGRSYRAVASVPEARELLEEQQPSLILLDWMLPGESGADLLRLVRERAEWCSIPVVVVTARAMEGDCEEFLQAGCDDYLAKPVSSERLEAVLERWLGVAESGREEPR